MIKNNLLNKYVIETILFEKKYLLRTKANEIVNIAKEEAKKIRLEDELYSLHFLLEKSTYF